MNYFTNTLLLAAAVGTFSTAALARGGMSGDTSMNTTTTGEMSMNTDAGSAGIGTGMNTGADTSARLSSNQVSNIQQSLRAEGYSLSVDGVWGPNTQQALRAFQQANNLDATGTVNQDTLAALEMDNRTFMNNR